MAATQQQWSCHVCTFLNHPDMILCEMCQQPKSRSHEVKEEKEDLLVLNDKDSIRNLTEKNVIQWLLKSRTRQLGLNFSKSKKRHTHVSTTNFENNSIQFSNTTSNHKVFGLAFAKTFKLYPNKFDRIVSISSDHRKVGTFKDLVNDWRWMHQLVNSPDSHNLNVVLQFNQNPISPCGYFDCITSEEEYDLVCNLIKHDKIISIDMGFLNVRESTIINHNTNQLTIDLNKLKNALKATNCLDTFGIVNTGGEIPSFIYTSDAKPFSKQQYQEIEQCIKEALLVNYSVVRLCVPCGYLKSDLGSGFIDPLRDKTYCTTYHKWWSKIAHRNSESEATNKALFDEEKNDLNTIWNIRSCHHKMVKKIVSSVFDIPKECFVDKNDRCFCYQCCDKRQEKASYKRGKPAKKYAIPKGWVRLGLDINNTKARMNKVFEEWHVSYHGTSSANVLNIFKSGLILLKAGDVALGGDELGVVKGHITKTFERLNQFTKQTEIFDPNQIFTTPSVKYASHPAYVCVTYIFLNYKSGHISSVFFLFFVWLNILI